MEDRLYHIEMEVITPLSVGAGNDNEWACGVDYVQKEGKIYILDIPKAVANGVDINRLTELFLKSDEKGICSLLRNQLEKVSTYVFTTPTSSKNPIKAFLRTQLYDKPLVAGSSIKGSIRSALFKSLRTDETENKAVFGEMKDGTDFMRFFHVGDIEMPSTILVNTKIFNLRKEGANWHGGWKHRSSDWEGNTYTSNDYQPTGFNTLYECVEPGKKGYGTIGINGHAYQLLLQNGENARTISHTDAKIDIMEEGLHALFHHINSVTRGYLEKEKNFFDIYHAERSEEITDCIDKLIAMIPSDDSYCLMKMSAGVGFHSITGDWQYENYDDTDFWESGRNQGKKKYKSRKIAEFQHHLQLMGFVKLRKLSEQEVAQTTTMLNTEHQSIIEGLMAPIKAREEAQRQAQETEKLKAQKKAEEIRQQEAYNALVQDATICYQERRWNDAIAKAQEASAICPDRTEYALLIEKCNREKDLDIYAEQEKLRTSEKFSQSLIEVLKNVTSVGNLIGTTNKWLKTNGVSFNEEGYKTFIATFRALSPKEQMALSKKRKELEKAIGKEYADRLMSELAPH